jgi:hypothetical protein
MLNTKRRLGCYLYEAAFLSVFRNKICNFGELYNMLAEYSGIFVSLNTENSLNTDIKM